jgi:hypothetical protein
LAWFTAGFRTKKLAGYPAFAAFVLREAVPSRSVAAAVVGLGFGAASRLASVVLVQVDYPPV